MLTITPSAFATAFFPTKHSIQFCVEEELDEFIEAIRYHAAQKLAEQREAERKEKEKAAIRARLAQFQAECEATKLRIAQVNADTNAWHVAQQVRTFVRAVKEDGGGTSSQNPVARGSP